MDDTVMRNTVVVVLVVAVAVGWACREVGVGVRVGSSAAGGAAVGISVSGCVAGDVVTAACGAVSLPA